MKHLLLIIMATSVMSSGCAQGSSQKKESRNTAQLVGGRCEGCEAVHESPVPFEKLPSVDTLPGFTETGPKLLVSGTVYQADGKTPAKDVVIYVYHTDLQGNYPQKGDETGWGKRHGYIRAWLKTDAKGQYKFYTLRPASYPNSNNPQHIHVTIKEPDKNEYWIDEYHFADDPLFTSEMSEREAKRGGSGIIRPVKANGIETATRDIFLGRNIPDYPASK